MKVFRTSKPVGRTRTFQNHPNFADPDHDLSDGASLGLAQFTPDAKHSNSVIGPGGFCQTQMGATTMREYFQIVIFSRRDRSSAATNQG
jgi:hypothetical protein